MKHYNNTEEKNAKVAFIRDLSLFEYAIAMTLIFAFALTLML